MTKPSDLFQANVEMWRYVTGQNAELVQKTIKQYGDLAYKNWECFLTHNEAFRQQVEKAVEGAVTPQLQITTKSIQALEAQISLLNEQIQRLLTPSAPGAAQPKTTK